MDKAKGTYIFAHLRASAGSLDRPIVRSMML